MKRVVLAAAVVSCQTPALHVAIIPTVSSSGGSVSQDGGCPAHCYDGTEDGLLAGCEVGTTVCESVPNGEELVGCVGEQFLEDSGDCGPAKDCFVAASVDGTPLVACREGDAG